MPLQRKLKIFQNKLINNWKIIFRILLSVQLGLLPAASYGDEAGGEGGALVTFNGRVFSAEEIEELHGQYEDGSLREYLDKHPEEGFKLDRFMMFSQTADLVRYELKTTPEGVVRNPYIQDTVSLNEYREHPITDTSDGLDLRIYYPEKPGQESFPALDREGRHFYVEGKHRGDIVFRQYIPELADVISDTQSQADPEFLVLLDPEKGLFIIDREAAPFISGSAPIPIINVPLSLSQEQVLDAKTGISVEFVRSIISAGLIEDLEVKKKTQAEIDQYVFENTTRPFDIIPQHISDFFAAEGKTVEGGPLFVDGDLAVVYTDSQNKRHLLEYIRRDSLREAVYQAYGSIDTMITLKSVADLLTDSEQLEQFRSIIAERKGQDRQLVSIDNIYSVVIEEALHKLMPKHPYFQTRRGLLSEDFRSHHFSLEEWKKTQQAGSQQEESEDQRRWIQKHLHKLAQIPQWAGGKAKGVLESAANIGRKTMRGDVQGLWSSFGDSWNQHPTRNLLLTAFMFGVFAPETFTFLLSSLLFTYAQHWPHLTGGHTYSQVIIYNIIMAGFGLILMGGGLLQLHKPALILGAKKSNDYSKANPFRFLVQWMEKSEKYQKFQWKSQHNLDLWEETQKNIREYETGKFSRKFIEMGIQLLAIAKRAGAEGALPLWNRAARILTKMIGQPLVMDSLRRGLNPFKRIRHQFEDNENAASVRLGWTGLTNPIYLKRQSSLYNEYKKIQDEFLEKSKRTRNLAFLLSVLAVDNPRSKDPDFIRSRGAEFFSDEITEVLSRREYKRKHHWILLKLLPEMMQRIDQINLSYGIDVGDEYIKSFYDRALELAEKYENTSYASRRLYLRVNRQAVFNMVRGALLAFEERYEFLKSSSPILPGERFAMELVPDHVMGKVITAGYLGRGSAELGRMHERDYDAASVLGASSVGIGDIGQNALAHGAVGGPLQAFGLMQNVDTLAENHNTRIEQVYPQTVSELNIDREQKIGEYLGLQLSYPFRFNGRPYNFGEVLRKRELGQWAMWQVLVLTVVLPRWATGELSFEQSLIASLVYNFAALPLYRWPWSAISGGAGMNRSILTRNYTRQRNVQISFLNLSRREGAAQEEEYRGRYQKALSDFIILYKKPSKNKKLQSFIKSIAEGMPQDSQIARLAAARSFLPEDIQRASVQSSMEEIQEVSKRFVENIVKEPPLPTRTHTGGNWLFSTFAGPVLTTLLATNLLIESWAPENLTITNVLLAFSAWSAFLLASNLKRKPYFEDGLHNEQALESWVSYIQRKKESIQQEISDYKAHRSSRAGIQRVSAGSLEENRENSSRRASFVRDTRGSMTLPGQTQKSEVLQEGSSPSAAGQVKKSRGLCRGFMSRMSNILNR